MVEEAQQAVDSAILQKEIEEDVVNEAIEKDIQTEMQKRQKNKWLFKNRAERAWH